MAVIYDDPAVSYDYGLVQYDGTGTAGTMSGTIAEASTMTGTITH